MGAENTKMEPVNVSGFGTIRRNGNKRKNGRLAKCITVDIDIDDLVGLDIGDKVYYEIKAIKRDDGTNRLDMSSRRKIGVIVQSLESSNTEDRKNAEVRNMVTLTTVNAKHWREQRKRIIGYNSGLSYKARRKEVVGTLRCD